MFSNVPEIPKHIVHLSKISKSKKTKTTRRTCMPVWDCVIHFLNVKYDTPTLSPPNQLASTVPWNQGSCRTLLWCPLWSDSQLYIVSSDVRIIITYLISSLLFFNWKVETGSPGWRATMLNMYWSSNTPVNLWPWTCRSQGEWLINAGMLLGKGTITNGPVSEDPLSRRAGDNLRTQSYAHQTVDHPQERDRHRLWL